MGPVWEDFPTHDVDADTQRMNHDIEAWVRQTPAQYYWVHKRFKTRPPGEPSLYQAGGTLNEPD
jgi:KDO2-lipid IV(A) lauroyltransferase